MTRPKILPRTVLTLALALVAALLPAGAARAADSFTFNGSGYGHGLGMSQWGAYGLAVDGWSHERILRHYYRGTIVGAAPSSPRVLRIGLVQDRSLLTLGAVGGPVEVHVEGRDGAVGTVPAGGTWTVRAGSGGGFRVFDASGALVGDQAWGGPGEPLLLRYREGRVSIPEAGHSYARGSVELNTYASCSGCGYRLRGIALLSPQAYLYGLGEVPSGWPMEALEAQAVAARSYALEKVARVGQRRAGCNCGLYASTYDQVYAGHEKESGALGERWVQAVRNTVGQVVLHDGRIIQAFYHASSGGHTENNENVWGGTPLPYLRGVCDPGDWTTANPVRTWSVTYSAATVTSELRPYTGDIGTVSGFGSVERGVSGRITRVTVAGTRGSARISGGELRSALGLRDDRVAINRDLNVTGAIRSKYDALRCRPGQPAGRERSVAGGERQRFERGAIYHRDGAARAFWLKGRVFELYGGLGGPRGALGFPTSDVVRTAGGTTAAFEHGRIACPTAGPCTRS